MDFVFVPIVILILCVIIFSICRWCCKRKREGTVYGYGPTVTVTSTTTVPPYQATGTSQVPYPVTDPGHPMPSAGGPPPAGFSTGHAATPYPQQGPYPPAAQAPYPPVTPPNPAPYPSYPATCQPPYPPASNPTYPPTAHAPYPPGHESNQPPPYDVAMSQPPVQPHGPMHEGYAKQSPYNPQYQG